METLLNNYFSLLRKNIDSLEFNLDYNQLNKAIDLIVNSYKQKGRIIFSAMGKSGIISKKAAASFSSSTPISSYFVHPSEAVHGDLGMIQKNDVIIFLSYSGESTEIFPVIKYAKQNNISTISITSNDKSFIAENVDIHIAMSKITEPTELPAPFHSVICTNIILDLLNIALKNYFNYDNNSYKLKHPSGKIGFDLQQISEIMHVGEEIPVVQDSDFIGNVIIKITSKRFGCCAVINNENNIIGIITDGDLRRHMEDNILSKTAKDIMTPNPKLLLHKNLYISEVVDLFASNKITNAFVVENNKVIGIVHIHDILLNNNRPK